MFKFRKKDTAIHRQGDSTTTSPSFRQRLRAGLGKTRETLFADLGEIFHSNNQSLEPTLEELETRLLMADVGVEATQAILEALRQSCHKQEIVDCLRRILLEKLGPLEQSLTTDSHKPFVILVIGVNGTGKTTTIGKLARRYQQSGKNVMLAAGDTFRAAAVEQLQSWGERHNIPIIAQPHGADAAAVIYDAFEAARARHVDILIADTAGRLHNKANLMEELVKIKRVLAKLDTNAPHETLLVLDAGTGQNAISQVSQFNQGVGITGLALTKLDGTAKGGILFALANQFNIPVRYIGIGEQAEDLREFNAQEFIDALLEAPEPELDPDRQAESQ